MWPAGPTSCKRLDVVYAGVEAAGIPNLSYSFVTVRSLLLRSHIALLCLL
jgi:hypothetical protein